MKTVSVTQLRHDWLAIESQVAGGESFLVRKRNRNLAIITPCESARMRQKSRSANALKGLSAISDQDLLAAETGDWNEA